MANQLRIFKGYNNFWYAEMWGEVDNSYQYEFQRYLKAVSYAELMKEIEAKGWIELLN